MQVFFHCKICDYKCNKKFLLLQHNKTKKHNANKMLTNANENMQHLLCRCGKKYKHKSSYSRHIKECNKYKSDSCEQNGDDINTGDNSNINIENKDTVTPLVSNSVIENNYNNNNTVTKILQDILKENKELKSEIKNLKTTTTNNNININVFLNEECKDAMNLTDFINNMKLSIEDLEYSGKYGYVKGMSNILMKNLTDIAPTQRPLHCSDTKRLKFYVKDNNAWERDTNNKKIDQSIDDITKKQHKILKDWVKQNPNYEESKEKLEEYFNIVRALIGGGDKDEANLNKSRVIKNVSNETNIKEIIKKS